MSTPVFMRCWTCHRTFVFLRGTIETCPYCRERYISHRDLDKLKREEKEE